MKNLFKIEISFYWKLFFVATLLIFVGIAFRDVSGAFLALGILWACAAFLIGSIKYLDGTFLD
jgi:hypothetical protein